MEQSKKPFVKGFKYRIYPDAVQIEYLNKVFGSCRFIWNRLLADAIGQYESYKVKLALGLVTEKPNVSGYGFSLALTILKQNPDLPWLSEIPSVPLQQTVLNLGNAYSDFFKRGRGYPKFKRKGGYESFRLVGNNYKVTNDLLKLPKLDSEIPIGLGRKGRLRTLPSKPTSCAISRTPTGKYYASFTCEYEPTRTTGTGVVGIDLGLKDFIVTSDGVRVSNPKHLAKYAKRLKKAQQCLARCSKGSKRRSKAKLRVAKLHERVGNARNDFQHRLTRKLINENQVIGIETLRVKNLVKNRYLAKAISDVAWSEFVRKLTYKAHESQHVTIVKMHAFYPSSHLCNTTGLRLPRKLKLSERTWQCPHCNGVHDRDVNAALNIRDFAARLVVGTTHFAGAVVLVDR